MSICVWVKVENHLRFRFIPLLAVCRAVQFCIPTGWARNHSLRYHHSMKKDEAHEELKKIAADAIDGKVHISWSLLQDLCKLTEKDLIGLDYNESDAGKVNGDVMFDRTDSLLALLGTRLHVTITANRPRVP